MLLRALAALPALVLTACVSSVAVRPVASSNAGLVCVDPNPELSRTQFPALLAAQLEARGLRTRAYEGRAPGECRYRLQYWADWRADDDAALRWAYVRVTEEGGKLAGEASYDARYEGRRDRYGSDPERVAALVAKLFPNAR
jgi:hypothetical protein